MAKAQTLPTGTLIRAKTRDSANSDISRLRTAADRLKANPDEARRLARSAGIYTDKGKLKKAYGG